MLEEDNYELTQGDVLLITRVTLDAAHRGHGLGLWMIAAMDAVHGGMQGLCALEAAPIDYFPDPRGGPDPPVALERPEDDPGFVAARDKLRAYYARLGFRRYRDSRFMIRWNGNCLPPVRVAMDRSIDVEEYMRQESIERAARFRAAMAGLA